MATFAERLREALIIKDISAAELSRITGVDEGTISNYKKGKYEPKQKRTKEIANALGVSVSWLLGADDVPINQENQSIRTDKLISVIDSMSDDEIQDLIEYAEFLKSKRHN